MLLALCALAVLLAIRPGAVEAQTGSSDASLSELSLSGVTLSPAFAGATTSYTASVANRVSSTTLTATQNDAAATLAISPDDAAPSTAGYQVSLDVGSTTVTVKVTAVDGTTTQTYTLTVSRAAAAAPATRAPEVSVPPESANAESAHEWIAQAPEVSVPPESANAAHLRWIAEIIRPAVPRSAQCH